MSEKHPSISQWRNLYNAAIEFRKLAPWEWMYDSDLFGVMNPENGETGYCCIMGNLGEHYALAVYLGTEGLEGYMKMQEGISFLNPVEALNLQKCIMVSFENREYLMKEDLAVIKKLGLRFRGANAWPLFRSYLPGYHPWFLTPAEADFLILALQQATDVAKRFKNDVSLLVPPEKGQYLVRVPEKKGDVLVWRDEWLQPEAPEKKKTLPLPDEKRLEKLKSTAAIRKKTIWEIDYFYSPEGVREKGERPYYPYVILWADHNSGLSLNIHLAKPSEYESGLQENC